VTDLLLRDVRLLDGTGAPPAPGTDVLVSDGLVAALGPTGTVVTAADPDPGALRVVDGAGLTLLPGFLDCHVHVSTLPGADTLATLLAPESLLTLRAVPHLSATLDAGVTTARDLAGADSGFREAVEQGLVRGPRLQVAIRILSVTGGHGDWRTVDGIALECFDQRASFRQVCKVSQEPAVGAFAHGEREGLGARKGRGATCREAHHAG